jgi:cobalamin-dependent methionine synthase I
MGVRLIIIGEKINGTIEVVRDAILSRDGTLIGDLAKEQADAGADYVDVNVGTGIGDEAEAMVWALGVVREATKAPICLDSPDPAVIAAGLEVCGSESPFINSVTGTSESMETVLPLAARHSCPLVGLLMDEAGIPPSPAERLLICGRLVEAAENAGIERGNLFIDPLVLPLSADCTQGRVTLETLASAKREFEGVKTVMGASNASFGLPRRSLINRSLLGVAVYFGLDAAIIDPGDGELRSAIFAAETVAGGDRFCKAYMKAYRAGRLG